jgi:ABC-type phosphate transport system substrate-binding protein
MAKKNRRLVTLVTTGAAALALAVTAAPHASADPVPGTPGTPPSGKTADQIYAGVGADAFAELTNNVVQNYNTDVNPTVVLASYDAVNPVTGAAGETITTKPGCTDIVRPNGANAGVAAILNNERINHSTVTTDPYCIDFVRSSRARGTASGEANLTFYAQSRDAVSYATVGTAYAPTTSLTTAQLKSIFECTDTDWSEVGGQAGPIHLYLPPTTAATYTFFLANVAAGCGSHATNPTVVFDSQQNDGRTLLGDPEGITPYAVTKWAAQANNAPQIGDFRGGTRIGLVNGTTLPFTTATQNSTTYLVLNTGFTTGSSASFGRYFFNVVRNDAPQALKDVFDTGGYLCTHQSLMVPFGNGLLTSDPNQVCGQAN